MEKQQTAVDMQEKRENMILEDSQEIGTTLQSDCDMPRQRTKDYNKPEGDIAQVDGTAQSQTAQPQEKLKLKPLFMELVAKTLGTLPFNTTLGDPGRYVKLSQLIEFFENNKESIPVTEMNALIQFMTYAPYNIIKPFMDYILVPEKQSELWEQA